MPDPSDTPMTREIWNDILMLLAIMVAADGVSHERELAAFEVGVARLRSALEPGEADLPPGAVRAWWHAHEACAHGVVASDDVSVAVLPWLSRLAKGEARERRQAVLDALADVSEADGHVCAPERDIVLLASAFWGLERARRT